MPTEDGRVMPWTGGEPLHDWSGPRHPASGAEHAEQHRPISLSSYMKSRVYRIIALSIIFNGSADPLLQWILELQQRLIEHGMDTPAYLPDPANPTVMLLVTAAYPKFTLQYARKCMEEAQKKWDPYTQKNNKDALAPLKNSITPALDRKLFDRRLDGDTTFAGSDIPLIS